MQTHKDADHTEQGPLVFDIAELAEFLPRESDPMPFYMREMINMRLRQSVAESMSKALTIASVA